MSKFILCFLLLLHFYNCQDLDKARVFEIPRETGNKPAEFKVRKGETFALKFYSNPSTGYSWSFLNEDKVSDFLLLIKSKYVAPNTPKNWVGAGGYMYYYFKGVGITNKEINLQFSYSRGGNKSNILPTQLVKITVY